MKLVSTILTFTVLASTVASAAVKLPNHEALEKDPRWVSYITYDGIIPPNRKIRLIVECALTDGPRCL